MPPDVPPQLERDLERRAALHAALGEPLRLAIVDELVRSDRAPHELGRRFGLPTNLLAHHLNVLERGGVVDRFVSSGDRRRRYVRVTSAGRAAVAGGTVRIPDDAVDGSDALDRGDGSALFVCTHNSARSQLAAALWRYRTGAPATSAGTHPADRVHPGAILAARRRGLDLSAAVPRRLDPADVERAGLVVTVCDRAHEEIELPDDALHWSIPDPLDDDDPAAFDRAADELEQRIHVAAHRSAPTIP